MESRSLLRANLRPSTDYPADLDGLPPGAHADGATLTFTAVLPDEAIEVSADLD
jgi:hypothetical protein